MNKNDREFMAQKIRSQYMEKETCELNELRALDSKVKRPAITFAYLFGSISAIVMGTGMSFVMTDISKKIGLAADPMLTGILIGTAGMLMGLLNYPIYRRILGGRKRKYGTEILNLSEKIINNT